MDNRTRRRFLSLQASISLGMIALGMLTSLIIGVFYYQDVRNQAREELQLRLRNVANLIAIQLDPQALEMINSEADVENEVYKKHQEDLSKIINANADLLYVYTMRKDDDGIIRFYLDAGREGYVPDPPGVVPYEQPTDLLQAVFAAPTGAVVEPELYTDEFGTFLSAYVPIYYEDGTIQSVLGIDISADTVAAVERGAVRKIWFYIVISLPFIVLLSWLLGYRLSRPSVALMAVTTRIGQITERNPEPIPTSSAGNSREAYELIQVFNRMSAELHSLIQDLEGRVAERTRDLAAANEANARRARQFEAVSQVAGATATVRSLDELLPRITQLISEKFNFYHVGIFLNDASNEYAVLSAANSEGGRRMLARRHQLKVGSQGIVGYVTGTGHPRVALNTGEDAVYFNNPDLPGTRSELALPLAIGGRTIGALDVQSTEPNAFGQDDIEVLSTLANQVSTAIQNARSFLESRRLLAEAQSIVTGYITESWKALRPPSLSAGFEKIGGSIRPLQRTIRGEHIEEAVEQGRTVHAACKLAVPIRLRGQIIGVLNMQIPDDQQWTTNEMRIAEAVAERLSLAIETATLIKATQRRANIERLTADITGKIGSSTHLETILQTAAQELSRALGGSEVLVQIEPVAMKLSTSG